MLTKRIRVINKKFNPYDLNDVADMDKFIEDCECRNPLNKESNNQKEFRGILKIIVKKDKLR